MHTSIHLKIGVRNRTWPYLQLCSMSLGQVAGSQLRFFQSVVHAEWEPFVVGGRLRAPLALPDENNSTWARRARSSPCKAWAATAMAMPWLVL